MEYQKRNALRDVATMELLFVIGMRHSSINITEIYTHAAVAKQKDILVSKHPRKNLHL